MVQEEKASYHKHNKILQTSTIKRSTIKQGVFLKRERRIRSCKFQRNGKLQVFTLKFGVASYEVNLEL